MELFYNEYEEAFGVFMTNGVHGEDWRKSTYSVALYTLDDQLQCVRAKSEGGFHVENYFIRHLLRQGILSSSTIKMYVSNSPCAECCQTIIRFSETFECNFEIVLSALYNVHRPSCVKDRSCDWHVSLVSSDTHEANVEGLRNLSNASRVSLRTFNAEDWKDLGKLLGVRPATDYRRQQEDDMLRNDLEEIMSYVD